MSAWTFTCHAHYPLSFSLFTNSLIFGIFIFLKFRPNEAIFQLPIKFGKTSVNFLIKLSKHKKPLKLTQLIYQNFIKYIFNQKEKVVRIK